MTENLSVFSLKKFQKVINSRHKKAAIVDNKKAILVDNKNDAIVDNKPTVLVDNKVRMKE